MFGAASGIFLSFLFCVPSCSLLIAASEMSATVAAAQARERDWDAVDTKSVSVEQALSEERRKRQRADIKELPVISLQAFLDGDAAAKEATAKQWDRACAEVGFIKIVDHGVPKDVIDACWNATVDLFDEPVQAKLAFPRMNANYPYGYSGIAEENLLGSLDKGVKTAGDLKEMFNVCIGSRTPAADHPKVRWPADSDKLQGAYERYHRELEKLSSRLYACCALALGVEEAWFEDKIQQNRNVIRAIHYPRQTTAPVPGQVRASMHTDYGALTILRLGGAYPGGLQVMGATGSWIDVTTTPDEDAYVINLGDLMARWTNDRWLSTPHRVVNPPAGHPAALEPRYSIAYFVNLDMDAEVECIPTCAGEGGAKYSKILAGEWLMRKHKQTIRGKLCYEAGNDDDEA